MRNLRRPSGSEKRPKICADFGLAEQLGVGVADGIASPLSQAAPARLLLASDADAAVGAEVLGVTYSAHADLLSNTIVSGSFSQLGINANFSGSGLATESTQVTTAVPQSEPLALMAVGLTNVVFARRRQIVLQR